MLAKIWKKALLIICILACLFNIISKLVNRTSLELQLDSVKNGVSLTEIFNSTNTDENVIDDDYESNIDNNIEEKNVNNTNATIKSDYIIVEY